MTIKELSQLYYLNREIEADKKRLDEISALYISAKSKKEEYCAEIAELKEIIRLKIKQCILLRTRIEKYIADIPDSLTRQIFALRFINGLSYSQIALHVGGNNTADGVRMRLKRYIYITKK